MPKLTEEEKKRRREEAEITAKQEIVSKPDFIGLREKRTHALMQTGLGERTARAQAGQELRGGLGGVGVGITERAEEIRLEKAKPEATKELEAAGVFEEVTPTERELSPDLKTDIAVLTPTLGAAAQISAERGLIGIARDKGWLGDLLPKVVTGEEAFPEPETPESLREAALRQIRINSFNKDTTRAEKFGAMMELLPGFGFIEKWVSGVVEAPHENATDVLNEINKIKEAASTGQEKVRNGLEDPDYGVGRARNMEEDLAKLSGRIKLLINQSKILQANTDQVNVIQEQILEAEEKVARYKQASSFGLTAQLTGTGRIIPTDEQLYYELKGGRK